MLDPLAVGVEPAPAIHRVHRPVERAMRAAQVGRLKDSPLRRLRDDFLDQPSEPFFIIVRL